MPASHRLASVVFLAWSLAASAVDADELASRFAAADKNHDGKLTLEEAQAGMPKVARNFARIDKDGKGYVTLDQLKQAAK